MRVKEDRFASYIRGVQMADTLTYGLEYQDVIEDKQEKHHKKYRLSLFAKSGESSAVPGRPGDGRHSLATEHLHILPCTGVVQHQV